MEKNKMILGSSMERYAVTGLIAIGLTVSSVGLAQQAKNPDPRFSFAGKRLSFEEGSVDKVEVVVSGADSEGRISLIESDWLPEFTVAPHFHRRHSETFYIVSGNVEWTIGGETHIMGPGDSVHIPPNTIHSVKVVSGKKMHSLMVSEPGGYEEDTWYEASYSPEQQRDPKIAARLRRQSDFNLLSEEKNPPQQLKNAKGLFSFAGKRTPYIAPDIEKGEVLVSANDSQGSMSLIESYWLPDFSVPPHHHQAHSETFYIFSGHAEWTIGGETHVMGPGDAVHIRPNTVHSVKVVGGEKLHTLWFNQPAPLPESPSVTSDLTPEERNDSKFMKRIRERVDFCEEADKQ
jgi:quercetin dioxygenase-like cupin family protein